MADSARRQLIFEVGGHLFAADARDVREVLEPTEVTPVPGAVASVLGLINLRGTLVVAGRLGALLELVPGAGEENTLVVFEHGERRLALEVDRVLGMAAYPDDGLDAESELPEGLEVGDLVAGVGRLGPRQYFHLDVGAIFERMLGQQDEGLISHGSMGGREQ